MMFKSTDWSALISARDRTASPGADAFARLIAVYHPAMVAHVQARFRLDAEVADDLVQQFILDRLLEQNLLAKADRSRGKFRALLVTSLNHFVLDYFKRTAKRPVSVLDPAEVDSSLEQADPFDQAWAESILTEALAQTSSQLIAGGREHYWKLFVARVVQASYGEPPAADYATLARQLGFDSPRDASNALTTAKRTFERVVRELLEGQEGDVEEKLADLHKILAARAVAGRPVRNIQ